ncbi:DUF418 domain-containing protein [bacterium]|nr:DUF418 domain-containing protein [bacterium]
MNTTTFKPVQERIVVLDVLRGFALLGVFLVNMLDFSSSALRADTLGSRGSAFDQIVDVAIAFFAITKFYLLFSFLFGVGFAVQMRRMQASGRPFVGFYVRRLAVLFVIGLAHAILLWDGDILRLYAAAGVLLLLVRNWSDRVLLALAGVIAAAGLLFFSFVPLDTASTSTLAHDPQIYQAGSYLDLLRHRLATPFVLDIQIPMVLVMFLVGLVVGRAGILDNEQQYRPFLRRWWKWALPFALVGNVLFLIGFDEGIPWLVSLGIHIGAPLLSFVYAAWVLLYTDKLRGFAPAGQMALTHYLAQSLIGTTLFYGYGFGLYDQVGPSLMLVLVLTIFVAQVIVSRFWLRRYRFGPMEWIWRCLTYGQWQPLRRQAVSQHVG